jgi:hypothetical protein
VTGDLNELTAPGAGLYERLIADLAAAGARYRLIDHQPEGRTELVSALRGHDVAHAAPRIARITAAASAPDTRTLGLKR